MTGAAMHVVQATAWYPPHHLGGTEVYVEGLVAGLAPLGITSSVLAPRTAGAAESYAHGPARVHTYAVNETATPAEMKENRPHAGFAAFAALLARHRGAIYHQHAWTRGCGPHHLKAAREAGLRTVLTVHVPGAICLRGTMLEHGAAACDGRVEASRCGACWAEAQGLPRAASYAVSSVPSGVAARARRTPGRLATALAARAHGAEKLRSLGAMCEDAERIVAVCGWLRDALAANGVPADKLVLSRQGLSDGAKLAVAGARPDTPRGGLLRIVYLGRWDPVKGVDIVVRAVRALPSDLAVELTIHAIPAPHGAREYEHRVRNLAGADPRIVFAGPHPRAQLADALARYDAIAVPSLWLETGPLVVLEAQAAGLFVLGSRRGGIAELVADAESGMLIEPGNVAAWSDAIAQLARRHAAAGLPRKPQPVRTMSTVAAEMAELYRTL